MAPCKYNPGASPLPFINLLLKLFEGDEEMAAYYCMMHGLDLVGEIIKKNFTESGEPDTAKSSLRDIQKAVHGETENEGCGYSHETDAETFSEAASRREFRPELVDMRACRCCFLNEGDESMRLDEATLKRISGGDSISARKPYMVNKVTYKPKFKTHLLTNTIPRVNQKNKATLERIEIVEFKLRFLGQDKYEAEKKTDKNVRLIDTNVKKLIADEDFVSGVLNALLAGLEYYYAFGWFTPERVKVNTQEYMDSVNTIRRFADNYCVFDGVSDVIRSEVYAEFKKFLDEEGVEEGYMTKPSTFYKEFFKILCEKLPMMNPKDLDIKKMTHGPCRDYHCWHGTRLKTIEEWDSELPKMDNTFYRTIWGYIRAKPGATLEELRNMSKLNIEIVKGVAMKIVADGEADIYNNGFYLKHSVQR